MSDMSIVETQGVVDDASFPYVPGLLSFREIPIVLQAFAKLKHRPDVVMADGQTVLVDAAIAKLDWAAEVTKSGFISADEEWKPTESLGLATGYMPNLKANHDRNALVAATTSAEILLFIADDVGYGSAAWDDAVRRNLVVSCVGTVGIRLTYPNGTLQHAGLVFGPNDRCEREGGGG